ncbi:hypothetical protein MEG1DRAFT_01551, partial [Photorhabdus temperata subsp. temperata Meg1]
MKNKYSLNEEEISLFKESVAGTKCINQDTVLHPPRRKK